MRESFARRNRWLAAGMALVASLPVIASDLPDGLVFSGLDEGQWRLYISDPDASGVMAVPTRSEPRTPAISADGDRIAYIGVDGSLREYSLRNGTDSVRVASAAERGLTHPAFGPRGRLIAVWLKDGKSVDTDLVAAHADSELEVVLPQRSAQFEPTTDGEGAIYYSNVACTVACGRVIQEIWRYHPAGGRAEQLTRLNAVSRQPYIGPRGSIYFSSNATGHYHIWRRSPDGGKPRPITDGAVVDSWPVVTASGTLYFLRHTTDDVALMRLERGERMPEPVDLATPFDNLKDLRLSRCATHC